ncbi:ATP-dependent helicase [Carboxylicivirga linearis]|uniref:DNA 3'-5' helicase n=1 Tax=Carboxylicivirga linearis TaxID=1628157 RepID=A0ABS5JZR2_9BACT|nr:ATP-dependent helicase [Carboxylicivirga linearis]MBS2100387.1 UvrD-helicase domain-containing protein [Carboxylicivirga linearis]
MNYKRLNAKLKSASSHGWGQIENAFEAEGRALNPVFKAEVNHPQSDYTSDIEAIRAKNAKLGITFERLNQHQRHAVFHSSQNTLLAAMVGSGKTTVLIAKVFYLHFIKGVDLSQMVVLTFTNKAAREIKERIASFLGEMDEEMNHQLRYFGTFHSVARQLLEEHPKLTSLGYQPGFMIMDEQEKQEFLQRIITQEGLTVKYQNQLTKRWKKYKETGSAIMGNMKSEDDLVPLIELAETEKRAGNSMDFDDLLTNCNSLLNKHGGQSPQWIIIDEFQDCNSVQLDLIENLKDSETNIFAVGDPNQSIYGWRGSNENIFREQLSLWDATWMELPHNYRSTEKILSAAESLLLEQNNSLIATRSVGTPIELVRHFDDQQEAYYLREKMISMKNQSVELDSVAILFRTHEQIKVVETVFSQADIPFQLGKRMELYDDVAQTFLLRIFKLCCNPNDLDSCLAIICDKTFGLLNRSQKLIRFVQESGDDTSVLQAMKDYLQNNKKSSSDHLNLLNKIEVFSSEFLEEKETNTQQLIDYLGLQNLLKPTSIHHKDYLKSVDSAWNQVKRYINEKGWGDRKDIFHVAIDQVVLEGTFMINDRIKEKGSGVHLLTIHAAKGLEFDKVYIAGANTGIIPLTQHRGSQNLKEEKRLLFVAITRGKNAVEIGWHAQPSFRNAESEPSYFLNAIPEPLLKRRISGEDQKNEKTSAENEEWIVNQTIKHNKYGKGIITSILDAELICTFEAVGEKSFSKAFARALITKVD